MQFSWGSKIVLKIYNSLQNDYMSHDIVYFASMWNRNDGLVVFIRLALINHILDYKTQSIHNNHNSINKTNTQERNSLWNN